MKIEYYTGSTTSSREVSPHVEGRENLKCIKGRELLKEIKITDRGARIDLGEKSDGRFCRTFQFTNALAPESVYFNIYNVILKGST